MTSTSRVLVAIAHHGSKNAAHLRRLLESYRAMSRPVDVVVLSDRPRDLGSDVEVRVGAPTKDPRSLPFAHRQLFAERIDRYDLFVYSEDDTLLEETHLDAFEAVNTRLPDDVVPGFIRYELRPTGERSYSSFNTIYRFDPASVTRLGGLDVASFSNSHSALYVVDRDQLRRAIRSGGFLVPSHEGVYSPMVTAATDIYVRCGLRRVLCLSRLEDFAVNHLPNVYLDRMGIDTQDLKLQVQALLEIRDGIRSADSLLPPPSPVPVRMARRDVFAGVAHQALRAAVEDASGPVLSIGCTTGDLERRLFPPGATIVGIPVDEVLGALARDRGVQTTPPVIEDGLAAAATQRFGVVLLHDLLKHVENPPALIDRARQLLAPGGRVVLTAPNGRRDDLRSRTGRTTERTRSEDRVTSGVHRTDAKVLRAWLRAGGCSVHSVAYRDAAPGGATSTLDRALRRVVAPWRGAQVVAVGVDGGAAG